MCEQDLKSKRIEIEDTNGNTIMILTINEQGLLVGTDNCDIADIEDDHDEGSYEDITGLDDEEDSETDIVEEDCSPDPETKKDDRIRHVMYDLFDEYENADDIEDALCSLNSEGDVTDEEYDMALECWDEWLKEWEGDDE